MVNKFRRPFGRVTPFRALCLGIVVMLFAAGPILAKEAQLPTEVNNIAKVQVPRLEPLTLDDVLKLRYARYYTGLTETDSGRLRIYARRDGLTVLSKALRSDLELKHLLGVRSYRLIGVGRSYGDLLPITDLVTRDLSRLKTLGITVQFWAIDPPTGSVIIGVVDPTPEATALLLARYPTSRIQSGPAITLAR